MTLQDQILPKGSYGWLWDARSRTPDEWVVLARACGLRGIFAKFNDGAALVAGDGSGQRWAEEFRKLVEPCVDAGLLLIPWGYQRPDDASGEDFAQVVGEAINDSHPANPQAFYIFDPEIEYDNWDRETEESGLSRPSSAEMTQTMFDNLKLLWLGGARWLYTSWGWPDQHPKFPWTVWQRHCEAFMPQVYPRTLEIPNPDLVWNRSYGGAVFGGPQSDAWNGPQGFGGLQPQIPIIPAFDIYDGVIPRLAELAANWKVPAVSWWVMDNFGDQTVAELAASPYAAKMAQAVADEASEVVGLRLALDRERSRADGLQRRVDRALEILKGG